MAKVRFLKDHPEDTQLYKRDRVYTVPEDEAVKLIAANVAEAFVPEEKAEPSAASDENKK